MKSYAHVHLSQFDLSHFPADSEFSVVGIQPSREKTYSLCLMKKRRPRVRRIEVEFEPDEVNGASAVEPNLKEMRARDDEEEGDDEGKSKTRSPFWS